MAYQANSSNYKQQTTKLKTMVIPTTPQAQTVFIPVSIPFSTYKKLVEADLVTVWLNVFFS